MAYPAGAYLVDTSILIRLDDTDQQARQEVLEALRQLSDAGNPLHIAPQSLVEFWGVATRPRVNNGLGLTPNQVQVRIAALQIQFDVLPETPTLFVEWGLKLRILATRRRLATLACAAFRKTE